MNKYKGFRFYPEPLIFHSGKAVVLLRYLFILFLIILAIVFTGCADNLSEAEETPLILAEDEKTHEDNEKEDFFELPLEFRRDEKIVTSSGIVIDAAFMAELAGIYEHLFSPSDYQRFLVEISAFMERYPDIMWPEIDYDSGRRISRFVENYRNGIKDSFIILGGAERPVNSFFFSLYDYDGTGYKYTYRTISITQADQADRILQGRGAIFSYIDETELAYIFGIFDNGFNNGQIVFPKFGWQPIRIAETDGEVSIEEAREMLFPFVQEIQGDRDIWLEPSSFHGDEDSYGFDVFFRHPETNERMTQPLEAFTVAKDLSWFAQIDMVHGGIIIQMEPAPPPVRD